MARAAGRRGELAARLRTVRASAFRSGQRFAAHLGWLQSRVSKLETGAQLPSEGDIEAWVAGAGADESVRAELLSMLSAARIEYVNNREAARHGGLTRRQARLVEADVDASRLGFWQPAMVPGLAQTASYSRELLRAQRLISMQPISESDVEGLIIERARRQEILYTPDKKVQLFLGEAALRSVPETLDTLLGQLDRLATLASMGTVELGIVPFTRMPIMPLCGFAFRGDRVVLESLTGEQTLSDPDEVAVYVKALDALREAALFGDDAVALIKRVIAELSGR